MIDNSNNPIHDVVIVGSGPAGYTAAIYCARAGLKPIVLAGSVTSGGALMNTTDVENYPGFPDGIMGPELMVRMQEQAEKFGAEIRYDDVTELQVTSSIKSITTDEEDLLARTVIIATGSAYHELGIDDEKRFSGRGVSYCATCDGFFFKDQDIAVVGGGDTAMEEAIFLTRFARKVTVVHRRDKLRASRVMAERAQNNPKIEFAWNSTIVGIQGAEKVSGITLRDTQDHSERELAVSGVFVAIGYGPRSDLVHGQVNLNNQHYILVDEPSTKTNLDGVFACGDVVDHNYRQAVTAAASGCRAALDTERYLMDQDDCGISG